MLWVLVDPNAPEEPRSFSVYGTGHFMPDNPGTFIGTFQMLGGDLIFHLFEDAGQSDRDADDKNG